MEKVKALRSCKISNKEMNYNFDKNEVKEVPEEHVNTLINTGLIIKTTEPVKKNEDNELYTEEEGIEEQIKENNEDKE